MSSTCKVTARLGHLCMGTLPEVGAGEVEQIGCGVSIHVRTSDIEPAPLPTLSRRAAVAGVRVNFYVESTVDPPPTGD